MKRVVSFACLLMSALLIRDSVALSAEKLGVAAGLSVEVHSDLSQSRVGAKGEQPIGAIDHSELWDLISAPPLEQDELDKSRRQLSISLEREALFQQIFKKQELYLMRNPPVTLSLEEKIEVPHPLDIPPLPLHHPFHSHPLPPHKVEQPLSPTHGMVLISTEPSQNEMKPPRFFIHPKPVTNQEYMRFVTATKYRPPSHWIGGKIPKGLENAPVVNVTYRDALTYAIWAGKRLPSKNERTQAEQHLRFYTPENIVFNEWTSSSYFMTSGTNSQSLYPANTYYKAVHSNSKGLIPMHKDDYNHYTGFRLILDAI